ncbi:hypothetical protein VTK73DRAFT_6913 [Phialemonium thermophilum]|uniref:MRH domain-containing protein n=1 Tax=Phialemonium thermophilum TaxID=223376 RepID=A0ABR3WHH7_9PEZI
MHPRSCPTGPLLLSLLLAASAAVPASAAAATATATRQRSTSTSSTKTTTATPCVATHASTGAFFDLRPDIAVAAKEGEKHHRGVPLEDYTYRKPTEWPHNFTMNICAPVVKPVTDVVGLDEALWQNVSAYYEDGGKIYSLGQLNTTLVPRGSQLVLRYSGGSPCAVNKKSTRRAVHEGAAYRYHSYDDEEEEENRSASKGKGKDKEDDDDADHDGDRKGDATAAPRRKSAIISFRCDRDPASTGAKLSFHETDEDECTYVFSILSQHACAKTEPHKPGSVGPGSVFAIIFFVAVLVYILGGVMYQRTVAHARGWRQLPNYSLWAGIFSFFQDFLIIIFSSCIRLLPRRRGYHTVSGSPSGRNRSRDDENRLIDQLDEEWDD